VNDQGPDYRLPFRKTPVYMLLIDHVCANERVNADSKTAVFRLPFASRLRASRSALACSSDLDISLMV